MALNVAKLYSVKEFILSIIESDLSSGTSFNLKTKVNNKKLIETKANLNKYAEVTIFTNLFSAEGCK